MNLIETNCSPWKSKVWKIILPFGVKGLFSGANLRFQGVSLMSLALLLVSGSVTCHPLLAYASLGLVDPHNTWQNQQKKTHPVGYWLRLEQTWRKLWRLMKTVKMPGSKTSGPYFEQMGIAKTSCENNGGSLEFLGKSLDASYLTE